LCKALFLNHIDQSLPVRAEKITSKMRIDTIIKDCMPHVFSTDIKREYPTINGTKKAQTGYVKFFCISFLKVFDNEKLMLLDVFNTVALCNFGICLFNFAAKKRIILYVLE
jgi:hypothetical protein